MGRAGFIVLLSIALLAAWRPQRAARRPAVAAVSRSPVPSHEPDSAAIALGERSDEPEPRERRASATGRGEPRGGVERRSVLLLGRVWRRRRPAPDFLVSFHAKGAEIAWELSDPGGAFELELPPGTYVVRSDELAGWSESVDVPGIAEEQELELYLPPSSGPAGTLRGDDSRAGSPSRHRRSRADVR